MAFQYEQTMSFVMCDKRLQLRHRKHENVEKEKKTKDLLLNVIKLILLGKGRPKTWPVEMSFLLFSIFGENDLNCVAWKMVWPKFGIGRLVCGGMA